MRFAEERRKVGNAAVAVFLVLVSGRVATETLSPVHHQRYAMGTMFDIIVYHGSRGDADRAIGRAMDEIVRLDQVLSHFKEDSDLSKLNREGGRGFVTVEPSLYQVLQDALNVSRRSQGKFDVTIAPLLDVWKRGEGRTPSTADISNARRCVGYEHIETSAPNRVRFRSDCLQVDLGGIGKGYAVDRALAILKAAGIRHAVVNAGSSSIAAIGAPPGTAGWPVRLGSPDRTLILEDTSISTSQQNGEIFDPHTGAPAGSRLVVSVVAPNAAVSDALSTTLLILSRDEGLNLIEQFSGVSAIWMTAEGELKATCGEPRLTKSGLH